jgi:hypothetical protein
MEPSHVASCVTAYGVPALTGGPSRYPSHCASFASVRTVGIILLVLLLLLLLIPLGVGMAMGAGTCPDCQLPGSAGGLGVCVAVLAVLTFAALQAARAHRARSPAARALLLARSLGHPPKPLSAW